MPTQIESRTALPARTIQAAAVGPTAGATNCIAQNTTPRITALASASTILGDRRRCLCRIAERRAMPGLASLVGNTSGEKSVGRPMEHVWVAAGTNARSDSTAMRRTPI